MASVTFTIPNTIATELNQIAVENGFATTKAMVIAYLRATIKARRGNMAIAGLREAAEEQAMADTTGIG